MALWLLGCHRRTGVGMRLLQVEQVRAERAERIVTGTPVGSFSNLAWWETDLLDYVTHAGF